MRIVKHRAAGVAAITVAVALLAAGCGVEVGNGGATVKGTGDVIGSATPASTTTPATTTTAPPPTDIDVEGLVPSEENDTAINAIADLQRWWKTEFPKVYDDPYEPVAGGFFALDSNTDPSGVPCSPPSIEDVLYNAYYCPDDDAVAWDQEGLMPDLAEQYGPFTVAVVLAHEWGHAIQERASVREPTVVTELQADCFAGAWSKHVADGEDTRFSVTTEDLDRALAGILSLRDAPGQLSDDPNAHGSGFDRVGAFQEGFEDGSLRCAEYNTGDPKPFQFQFNDDSDVASGGDMPLDDVSADEQGINTAAFDSLDAFWKLTFPEISGGEAWKPLNDPVAFSSSDPPSCNGEVVKDYLLFLCVPDRYIAFDNESTIPDVYKEGGDFAVAALYATQYGLEVQQQLGDATSDEVTATLRGDCYAGAWSAALLPPEPFEEEGLVLSPGDLDEAVGVMLSFRSEADRDRQGPGFGRVSAFRRGVLKGAESCADIGS